MDDTQEPEEQKPDEKRDRRDSGGFAIRGPFGFGAEFPRAVARESRWIIRAIAVAIILLSAYYGWSLVK